MSKVTPDPPETNPKSSQQPEAKPRDIPSFADIKATPRTPGTLFAETPKPPAKP